MNFPHNFSLKTVLTALIAALLTALALSACAPSASTADNSGASSTPESTGARADEPGRVVVLDGRRDLDIALSLGLNVVGFPVESEASASDLDSPLKKLTDASKSAGAKELFDRGNVNLEAIAAARPSTIIGRDKVAAPILAQLEKIAPVVQVGSVDTGVKWQDDLAKVAAATGTEEKAAQLAAAYEQRIADLKEKYADALGRETLTQFSYNAEDLTANKNRLPVQVMTDLGATLADNVAAAGADSLKYSHEETSDALSNATLALVSISTPDELALAKADPLLARSPLFALDRWVRTDKFTNDGGPSTAMFVTDLVAQLLDKAA